MKYRVGILSHEIWIDTITSIVDRSFPELTYEPYSLTDISNRNEFRKLIIKAEKENDSLLFSGNDLMEIASTLLVPSIEWFSLKSQGANIYKHILQAAQLYGSKLDRICFDTYTVSELNHIFSKLGLEKKVNNRLVASYDILDEEYKEKLVKFHKENILNNRADVCLTSLSDVYYMLKHSDIPCINMYPSQESIFNVLADINSVSMSQKKYESDVVIMAIEINHNNDYSISHNIEYDSFLSRTEISKHIYRYAHSVHGTVMEVGSSNYFIFTTKSLLEKETNTFSNVKLLNQIYDFTSCTISIGIGYGETVRESKQNSLIALKYANKCGGNVAYIFFAKDKKMGPISPTPKTKSLYIDDRLYKISEETSISTYVLNEIIIHIIESGKNTFTSKDISELLNATIRTANRLLIKLETFGYAKQIGKKYTDGGGRPSRVMEISLLK